MEMATCQDVSTLIARSRVKEFPVHRRLALWMHVAACRHCRRFHWQIRMLDWGARMVLDGLGDKMPPDLPERTVRRLSPWQHDVR